MAHKIVVLDFMFVYIVIGCLLSHRLVEGRHVEVQEYLHLENNGTTKTIKSGDRDVIDCINIHKQPAFDHPLVNKIQLKPTSYPKGLKPTSSQSKLTQIWHKNGKCPQGTVPIRRTPKQNFHKRAFPSNSSRPKSTSNGVQHEYATAQAINNDKFYGGHASINVWSPKTEPGEFSLSQIWLTSDTQQGVNTIEAGWIVYPQLYGDYRTRLFVYWTRDGYKKTGCYDLRCSGFMQTNRDYAMGSAINPLSTYDGDTLELTMTIWQDKQTANWWLQVQGIIMGYWPGSIFTGFAQGASLLLYGGEIINERSQGRHTTTQMGSGRFPYEGFKKTSYFRDINFVDNTNTLRDPQRVTQYVISNPLCYDIDVKEDERGSDFGIYFYYGGLGYSSSCP